jgi:hypothetical protein
MSQYLTSKGNHKLYSTLFKDMTFTILLKSEKRKYYHYMHSQGDYFEGDASQN